MKRVIVFLLLFLPCLSFAQAHLNGTVLTLSNGTKIPAGSQVRVLKPAKGSRFTYIYSELALRASSEEDLPYGVSSSLSNQDVTVKRFLERKGNAGNKIYLICSGSFIKNAIDIENAIKAGEVSVGTNVPAAVERPAVASNSFGQTATNPVLPAARAAASVSAPAQPVLSAQTASARSKLIRRPWDPIVIPVSKDTLAVKDSSKRFVKAFKSVDSLNNALPAKAPVLKADSGLKITRAKDSLMTTVKDRKSESAAPLINASARVKKTDTHADDTPAETVAGPPDSEHSVSALMTLPSAESLKPKEVPAAKPGLNESSPGYTKFAKLKQLKELLDSGVLTKAEFDAEKKKILLGE